jgi:hypothetical protein
MLSHFVMQDAETECGLALRVERARQNDVLAAAIELELQ